MRKFYFLILICLPINVLSQHVAGKIYDAEATVKGAKIINLNLEILEYSDAEGNFRILARKNDILEISSLFHEKLRYEVKAEDFDRAIVIELVKMVNELDEVDLKELPKAKEFDSIESSQQISEQIANDIKNRPELYTPVNSMGMDFIAIAKLIGSIFKAKKKPVEVSPITYAQLDSLFSHSRLFNERLLYDDFKIPTKSKYLFFEYTSAKNLPGKLIKENNELILLDSLNTAKTEFLKLLKEFKED